MKKYLLFIGVDYDELGGWKDFVGSFSTIDECHKRIEKEYYEFSKWYHIVDVELEAIVDRGYLKRAGETIRDNELPTHSS